MIAIKLAGWMQKVVSAFIKFGRIGAGSYLGIYGVHPVGIGGTEYIHGANLKDDGRSFCGSFAL